MKGGESALYADGDDFSRDHGFGSLRDLNNCLFSLDIRMNENVEYIVDI